MKLLNRLWKFVLTHKFHLPIAIYDHIFEERRIKESTEYWNSLKNIHRGKRGFVIGNGPSLKLEDLERLKGEVTIASNKIYLAFDQVTWRPTYFTSCDKILWPKMRNEIGEHVDTIHLASYIRGITYKTSTKVKLWRYLGSKNAGLNVFSDDIAEGAFGGGTVTYENLQIAVHLGLNPIYIIGCDHFYAGEDDLSEGEVSRVEGQSNHFIKNYRKPGEVVNSANLPVMNQAYRTARAYADANGIQIINATRGGFLEIFQRANLDSVLDG